MDQNNDNSLTFWQIYFESWVNILDQQSLNRIAHLIVGLGEGGLKGPLNQFWLTWIFFCIYSGNNELRVVLLKYKHFLQKWSIWSILVMLCCIYVQSYSFNIADRRFLHPCHWRNFKHLKWIITTILWNVNIHISWSHKQRFSGQETWQQCNPS